MFGEDFGRMGAIFGLIGGWLDVGGIPYCNMNRAEVENRQVPPNRPAQTPIPRRRRATIFTSNRANRPISRPSPPALIQVQKFLNLTVYRFILF